MPGKKQGQNLGTISDSDSPAIDTGKRGKNIVPKHRPGFIRRKTINGRDYYYHVKTIWTPDGPRQKTVAYLGTTLPKGLRLGPVNE